MKNPYLRPSVFFLTIELVILLLSPPTSIIAKELPVLVKLSELDASFDGLRVTVFGWARSTEVKTGRRGSLHLKVIVGRGERNIVVFTIWPVHNIVDREVIVQGIYHSHGRFAGFEEKHFIVADTIIRNWEENGTESGIEEKGKR